MFFSYIIRHLNGIITIKIAIVVVVILIITVRGNKCINIMFIFILGN